MKNLYIIGNGFDLYHGLKTKYSDFKEYLKKNNKDLYDFIIENYDIDDSNSWWCNFEHSLSKLKIKDFLRNSNFRNTYLENIFLQVIMIMRISERKLKN